MKLTPLTAEQQALCVKWRPLAIRYALKLMQRRHDLSHHMDEAEGIADEACVRASRVYESSRGSFASCLEVWVRNRVEKYRAHGAPVVSVAVGTDAVVAWSADAQKGDTTWLELLEAPDDEREALLDSADLWRRANADLPPLIAKKNSAQARKDAKKNLRLWLYRMDNPDITLDEIGKRHKISRQAVCQRIGRAQAAFEHWAAAIRAEAA